MGIKETEPRKSVMSALSYVILIVLGLLALGALLFWDFVAGVFGF